MSEVPLEVVGTIETLDRTQLTVRLPDDRVVSAVLDSARLRARHGFVYGLSVGDEVVLELEQPARVIFLITYAAQQDARRGAG